MRIRTIFIIMFFLCVTISHAQKKLFQEAIKAGRQPTKFYVMKNDKNKMVRLDDLKEFAQENGYILGESTNKQVDRFGDIDTSVATIEFLPIEEYESYIVANIFPTESSLLSTTPSQGMAYFFYGINDNSKPFIRHDAVTWYGSVSNEGVQGKSIGYIKQGNKIILSQGEYVDGFPMGTIKTITYDTHGNYDLYQPGNISEITGIIGKMSDGMATIKKGDIFGFVNKDGGIAIVPKYLKVVSDFSNGKAIVVDNEREIVIDHSGQFLDLSDRQKQLYAEAANIRNQAIAMAEGKGTTRNIIQSVELFKKAAIIGDAEAQFRLGRCYYESGEGVIVNADEAVKWLEKAANQNNPKALALLGKCYNKGNGVRKDSNKADELWRKAFPKLKELAEKDDAEGQFYLGLSYFNGAGVTENPAQAFEWSLKAAEQGNTRAQLMVGELYRNGEVVEKDDSQAVSWYRKAADQGFAPAQHLLGKCYDYGIGVQKDIAQAVSWYRKAADQGEAEGQAFLGRCYENGVGVPQNTSTAIKWYEKSADQGCSYGQQQLGAYYYFEGHNMTQAFILLNKAAEQGESSAQALLGQCYRDGDGVDKNLDKAVKWYQESADQGNGLGLYGLAGCYDEGAGVGQDKVKALDLYQKAAEEGLEKAFNSIGLIYESGEGIAQNLSKAYENYKKGAELGHEISQFNLARCYQYGYGVQKNMTKAIEWYQKAADQGYERASNAIDDIRDANARKKKMEEFTRRLGYNPDGTSITKLVSVGRSISAVIDYINNYYVGGYDWFINLSADYGNNYKEYKLYRVTSGSGSNRRGTLRATLDSVNGRIQSVIWK